jgi:hypothetical protein
MRYTLALVSRKSYILSVGLESAIARTVFKRGRSRGLRTLRKYTPRETLDRTTRLTSLLSITFLLIIIAR